MDPVNMATGEFIYEDMDFILPDMGGEYGLARRYTGPEKKKPGRSIGKAWALSTDTYVIEESGTATVTMPDGRTAEYTMVKFIYSGRDVACEEAEDTITRYVRGNGSLVASDSESARTYYHYACDSLGSITHVIAGDEFENSELSGDINSRILCRYGYDAFGSTINAEETITNRYGFTGEMHDDITGMYYLRARYYALDMGRFTQADTYHGDGLNLYVYAGNNPVKYVDPSGHGKENGVARVGESGTSSNRNGSISQVGYGSTNLSQKAIQHRQENDIRNARNIAVFEYENNGQLNTIARASQRKQGHAERLIAKELHSMGIESTQVRSIYSELEPCSIPGGYCKRFLQGMFPQADITYSFRYGLTKESRRAGVKALKRAVKNI